MKGSIRFISITFLSMFIYLHASGAIAPASAETLQSPTLDDSQVPGLERALVAEWFANVGHAKTVQVSTSDQLIAAINAANASGHHTTIRVSSGTYSFTQEFSSADGTSQLPPITGSIAIVGADPTRTVLDGSGSTSRAITVLQGAHLLVRDLTIKNFNHICDYDSCPTDGGGAFQNIDGNLRIEHSVLDSNSVTEVDGETTLGGHIYNLSGRLEIEDSTLNAGLAINSGGGIALTGGTLILRDSILSNNVTAIGCCQSRPPTFGGGLYVQNAKAWILHSTFTGNTVGGAGHNDYSFGAGAAIHNDSGQVWIFDSSIVNNTAFNSGFGGGINNQGTMVVINTTVAGNAAGSGGGGIFNFSDLTLQGVTITGNAAVGPASYYECPEFPRATGGYCDIGAGGFGADVAATTRIATSVIAGNLTSGDCSGLMITRGHNAFGSNCELQPASNLGHGNPHDLLDIDARLGTLVDNGEPGEAHVPPLPDSPLIDAGGQIGRFCTPRDQIGTRRINARTGSRSDAMCDIGAIEFLPAGR
jgi:hypothetical protein